MNKPLGAYPIRTFDDFRNVAQLYQYSRLILTALELDLFSTIGDQSWRIPSLARRLKVSIRGLDILCRNLAALGLLAKAVGGYRNSRLGRTDLNRRSPAYRGEYLTLIQDHWDDFAQLTRSVRRGKPIDEDRPDDPTWRRAFTWAMHHRSREQALRVARTLDLSKAQTLLDLGGGPGTYALAFLAQNPTLHATVADRLPALEVARAIAATYPGGTRLSFAPLDFMRESLPGRYDVVWLSNVIHIYSPAQNLALVRKVAKALHPGGRLLIQDTFLTDAKGLYPLDTTAFALTMLLFTESGNTYPLRDVRGWLRQAGYVRVRTLGGLSVRQAGENRLLEGRTIGVLPTA